MLCLFTYFCSFVEVIDVIVKIFEASMCYVGVIDVYFLVLIGQSVGSINTALHVINLILYILCGLIKEINVFF